MGSTDAGAHEARTNPLVRLGHFLFRYRDLLVPVVLGGLLLTTRRDDYLGSERLDRWLDVVGFLTACLGQALRAAVIGLAYIHRGGKNKTIYAQKLVVEGFFAHSRNPLYLGNLLVLAGLFLILNTAAGYAIGVPLGILLYAAIIAAEESHLSAQFGEEYEAYRRSVPRLFPRLHGLGKTMRSMKFDWRRLLRKEYGSTFSWLTAALAMLAWERVQWEGFQAARPELVPLAVAWGFVIAAWVAVRVLKKTGRLASA